MTVGITILVPAEDAGASSPLQRALAGEGFLTVAASHGREALELARRLRPNLVVLETAMGRLNGWELLRALQAETRVPVVLLAPRANDPDVTAGLELGADDCVAKPVDPHELAARVRAVLRRTRP